MTNDELSAKVAEARGEVVFRKCNSPWAEGCHAFISVEKAKEPRWSMPDERPELSADAYHDVKPYTTDMNAAWELVEEMENIIQRLVPSYPKSQFCDERKNGVVLWIYKQVIIQDDTMPRAICRAYLAFKGVEI